MCGPAPNTKQHMQLIDEWKMVASKAWSVRLLAGAGLLQLLDLLAQLSMVLPQLDGILPARTFQALSLLCVLASLVARFVHQPEMHQADEGQANPEASA